MSPRFAYSPTSFDGTNIAAGNYARAWFMSANGPGQTRSYRPIEAEVVGLGDRLVRQQPKGMVWELHIALTAIDETDLDSFYETFSEEKGAKVLKVTDGDAVVWRVNATVIRIQHVGPTYFIVHLRVSDPTFAAESLTTDTNSSTSGDSDSSVVTNTGNRKAKPKFTFKPVSTKTKSYNDYILKSYFFIVNRSPFALNKIPVTVCDQTGADAVHDHATLVGNTQTRALVNDAGNIDATQTTIIYDTGQNGNPPLAGIGYIDSEQITWTGGGGGATGTLMGVKRGVGGTTAATHLNNAAIKHSQALENGDDVRVWLNHVEVERWLAGVNTANLHVWSNVSMPPSPTVRLKADITAGSPASGGDLEVKDDISDYPESGVLNIGGNNEAISYQSKDIAARKFKTIERGAWTSPASTASEDDLVYVIGALGVLGCGKGNADQPPDRITHRPAIDLLGAGVPSRNNHWRYGDRGAAPSSDPDAAFYDPDNPDRTAMFRPSYEVPTSDKNNAEPLRLDSSLSNAAWKSSSAASGKPLVGRLALALPQGIEAVASAITYNVQKRRDLRLRILGRDIEGLEVELSDDQDVDEAIAINQVITPTAPIHKLILNAVWANVMGENNLSGSDIAASYANAVGEGYMQKFILDQTTDIVAVATRLRKTGSGDDFGFTVRITEDESVLRTARVVGDMTAGSTLLASGLTTGFKWYQWTKPSGAPLRLAAGTYWLQIKLSAFVSGALKGEQALISTKHNELWVIDSAAEAQAGNFCMPFMVIHAGGGPIQPEVTVVNEDAEANFGRIILELDDGASTRKVPFVHRTGNLLSSETTAYHCVGTFKNTTTSQEIAIDLWMEPNSTLTIDCDARTAIYTFNNEKYDVLGALTFTDDERWCDLDPGANTIQYVENDMVNNTWEVIFRSARV